MDPIILTFDPPPRLPLWQRLEQFKPGPRSTKIVTIAAAIVLSMSMAAFVVFTTLANNTSFQQTHNLPVPGKSVAPQTSGTTSNAAAQPGGGSVTGTGGTTGANSPVVTLTATPGSVAKGDKSTLAWSVTNNPTSCQASDDWSGTKSSSGSESTAALTTAQTYLFTLTCRTATGTGFASVPVSVIDQGGTGDAAVRPIVHLAPNPATIYTGETTTLSWTTDNNPTSCTASGTWSGALAGSGTKSTGVINKAGRYSYTLTCKNAAGSGYATASILVNDPPPGLPIVTLASTPSGPITPGSSVNLSWSSTNSPTSCTASGDWSGAKGSSGSQNSGALNTIKTYTFTMTCANSGGSTFDSAAVQVIPNPPVVALSVNPTSIFVGSSATITWSATNSPTTCTASGDWSGAKGVSGSISTGVLSTAKTYSYSLSCTNAGGTGYVNNVHLVVSLPPSPIVTLSASPISVTTGSSSTLSWSSTNSPTSCTASGDWTGAKASSGTQNSGTLNTVRTYSYSLSCSNAGGTGSASSSVSVSSGAPPASPPVVTISVSPATIGTGSSATLSWSTTNSPTSCTASGSWSGSQTGSGSSNTGIMATAGNRTYTLTCSNSAGSSSASATLTVIAVPVVTVSLSPASITTGGSSTITWNATNSPTSCTAGGSWSGSKAASGSVTTGAMSTPGTFTYSLTCLNAGGSGTGSGSLTVANAATVYCSGSTPCYGPTDLATRSSPGNCWGWNLTWVINITSFRPSHPGGIKSGASSTIENASATCNHSINAILVGSATIPGYQDASGSTKHGHNSSTQNNSGGSILASYRVGYYDPTKP